MAIRRLGTSDWERYRDVRLEALATDPHAFCSRHERESTFDRETWESRLVGFDGRPGQVFLDEDESGAAAGIAGAGTAERSGESVLWGMWVRPASRGRGVAERLIEAAIGWSAERSLGRISLWVMEANAPAQRLYERCGFEVVGPVIIDGHRELEMARPVP